MCDFYPIFKTELYLLLFFLLALTKGKNGSASKLVVFLGQLILIKLNNKKNKVAIILVNLRVDSRSSVLKY